jgi:hypothetical protein
MTTPMFIWLGSGRARRRAVGPAAALLDQAAGAGLPVPAGAVLLDEFYRVALETGLARADGRRVAIPDAELWHNTLRYTVRLPHFRGQVIVRPVGGTDGETAAATPPSLVCRDVHFDDATAAARAVAAVWSAVPAAARHDALILEAIAATTTGTALMADGDGPLPDRVMLDATPNDILELAPLRGHASPDPTLPAYARRLQQLLRGARRTFGPGRWRVAWADDGHICWLVGAAPA